MKNVIITAYARSPFTLAFKGGLASTRVPSTFILIFIVIYSPFALSASVFKCEINGKTTYQSTPCPDSDDGQIDLNVSRPTNKQIYDAQERLESWNREKERQGFLYDLEIKKANAATKQADAKHDVSVARRKATAIKLRRLEMQNGEIRTLRERDALRKKWDEKIDAIK